MQASEVPGHSCAGAIDNSILTAVAKQYSISQFRLVVQAVQILHSEGARCRLNLSMLKVGHSHLIN